MRVSVIRVEAPELIIHGVKEARRAYVPSLEEARSKARLVEVEALVLLTCRRMSYSTSIKVMCKGGAEAWDGARDNGVKGVIIGWVEVGLLNYFQHLGAGWFVLS